MSELNLGGGSYNELITEVASVSEELLRQGAQASAVTGAIEFYRHDATTHMDDEQLTRFNSSVARTATTAVIDDPEASPTEAYKVLGAQRNDIPQALFLAEYGKDLDKYGEDPGRAIPVLAMAAEAFKEVYANMDQPLKDRITFFTEEYVRVVGLQNWAGDRDGESKTANDIVEAGEALFAEAKLADDLLSTRLMNAALIEIAGSLKGGIENPKAQRLLRLTTPEHGSDFLKQRKLASTADTLLKCGMVDAAFGVYALTSQFDANKVRENMRKRGGLTDEQIEEHIRHVNTSFPGFPWTTIFHLQSQPQTEEYVEQILDRIEEEYPSTYATFSYAKYMCDPATFPVLVNSNRADQLAAIVRGNGRGGPNLQFMAFQVAATIMAAGKQELYDKVYQTTADVEGASEGLKMGYDAVIDPGE